MINQNENKKHIFLLDYTKIADIHANRLNIAILKTAKLFPIKLLVIWEDLKKYIFQQTTI